MALSYAAQNCAAVPTTRGVLLALAPATSWKSA